MVYMVARKKNIGHRVEVWTDRKKYEVREYAWGKLVHRYQTDHRGDVWGEVADILANYRRYRWFLVCRGLIDHDYIGRDQEDSE